MSTVQTAPSTPAPPPITYEQAEAAWLEERKTFIGGSELYQLFDIPQYGKGCKRALAYEKLGVETTYEPTPEDEALFRRGHLFEPLAAGLYEEKTGRKVRRPPLQNHGFTKVRRHPDYPFLGVHTDRTILAGYGGIEETGDLEIKSHGEGMFLRVMRLGLPLGHMLQIQHSLLVNRRPPTAVGSIAMIGVFGGLPLEYADTKPDGNVHDQIKRTAEPFWNNLTKGNLPDRLPDKEDMRCQTCQFRLECRGEDVSQAAVAFLKKNATSDKELVQIDDPELTQDVVALATIKEEIKALTCDSDETPGAVELLERKILDQLLNHIPTNGTMDAVKPKIDVNKKPFFPGVGSLALYHACAPGRVDGKKLQTASDKLLLDLGLARTHLVVALAGAIADVPSGGLAIADHIRDAEQILGNVKSMYDECYVPSRKLESVVLRVYPVAGGGK